MYGCGTVGHEVAARAVALHLAVDGRPAPRYDVTYLFYDCEEVEAERNGLRRDRAAATRTGSQADFAILLEPTVRRWSRRAARAPCGRRCAPTGSARPLGPVLARASTRSTGAGAVLQRLRRTSRAGSMIDGCEYREGLNAVDIRGGVAGNVIPDRVRGRGQLPVRPGPPVERGARRTCARSSTGSTSS